MSFSKTVIFLVVCIALLGLVSAAPEPGNFFKDLEGVGQRIRDSIISAGPAVQVVKEALELGKKD